VILSAGKAAMTEKSTPICPRCGKPMSFARSVPSLGGLPELRTFHVKLVEWPTLKLVEWPTLRRSDKGAMKRMHAESL
jgi:hypothetical protein